MAYPSTITTLPTIDATSNMGSGTTKADTYLNAVKTIVEALQAKVGVTSSAVTTSHDYKLSGVTGADKAASLAGDETLTNKKLTSPVINTLVHDPTLTYHYEFPHLMIEDATDTLVVVSLAQTLTSKTLTAPKLNENVALTSTSTELNLLHGKLGAWIEFTPSWTNLTVGAGENTGRYSQVGKTVNFYTYFVYGSGSAVGTDPKLTLPVTISSTESLGTIIGNVKMFNAGSAAYFGIIAGYGYIYAMDASAAAVKELGVTATVPFTFGAGDSIAISGTYESV